MLIHLILVFLLAGCTFHDYYYMPFESSSYDGDGSVAPIFTSPYPSTYHTHPEPVRPFCFSDSQNQSYTSTYTAPRPTTYYTPPRPTPARAPAPAPTFQSNIRPGMASSVSAPARLNSISFRGNNVDNNRNAQYKNNNLTARPRYNNNLVN